MELLLKSTVEHLGRVGDVVKVRPGYARNYLLPLGYAVPVTKANMAEIEKARAQALAEEQERVEKLKAMSEGRKNTLEELYAAAVAHVGETDL